MPKVFVIHSVKQHLFPKITNVSLKISISKFSFNCSTTSPNFIIFSWKVCKKMKPVTPSTTKLKTHAPSSLDKSRELPEMWTYSYVDWSLGSMVPLRKWHVKLSWFSAVQSMNGHTIRTDWLFRHTNHYSHSMTTKQETKRKAMHVWTRKILKEKLCMYYISSDPQQVTPI